MPKHNGPDLKRYMEKRLRIKLNGKRQVSGVLRGYDQFMNLVLDESTEELAGDEKNEIGMVVRLAAHRTHARAPAPCGHAAHAARAVAAAYATPSWFTRCPSSAVAPRRSAGRACEHALLAAAALPLTCRRTCASVLTANVTSGGAREQCYPDGVLGSVVRRRCDAL